MRALPPLLALALCLGCGNEVDHPEAAPECDPAIQNCSYRPPMSGGPGPSGGGGGSSNEALATVSGQIISYVDDFFDQGLVYSGEAEVSAIGRTGARVKARYDGSAFELEGVRKQAENWFMVEPPAGSGMLATVTPIDTRIARTDQLRVGITSELNVDGVFALSGSGAERAASRAQIVARVVDEQGLSVPGVQASVNAEVTAYRAAGAWLEEAGTDESGMIFMGNLPASGTLAPVSVVLRGAVSARVDVMVRAGATTVVTAIVGVP